MPQTHLITTVLALACTVCAAQTDQGNNGQAADPLAAYLVDVTSGSVSASNLVGVSQSAVTQIQTSQDVVVALKPFVSGGSKSGFGLSVTPARTALTPMSGRAYLASGFNRLLGSATVSYAQNNADISAVSYRKQAYSVDTMYYLRLAEDPIAIGEAAFGRCAREFDTRMAALLAEQVATVAAHNAGKMSDVEFAIAQSRFSDQLKAQTNEKDTATRACIDADLKKAPWNSAKIAVSFGQGWIQPTAGGSSRSLGKTLTLNAQLPLGPDAAALGAIRRTQGAVDTDSLATVPTYSSSSLIALRLTYGSHVDESLKALIEVSNAKNNTASTMNNAFKYALGVDKKIFGGMWLEFRVGRNRTSDNKGEQTTALLNLKVSSVSKLFGK
jgi:hypothetical protein